jgi:hypothetical protein
LQVIEQVLAEPQHVGAPAFAGVQPLAERVRHRGQVEEEVLGLDELRRLPIDLRAGVAQVDRVELVAAVVALVAARGVVVADRAGALDVAVRKRAPGRRGDRAERGLRDDVAVAVQRLEQVLDHRVVVAGGGPGEQVVRQAEPVQILDDHAVVAVDELPRAHPLGVGLHLDRSPVLVGP